MKSIVFVIDTKYRNNFWCNYLGKKIFLEFFLVYRKFKFNFEHFQKKDDPHSWCIFDFTDSKKCG